MLALKLTSLPWIMAPASSRYCKCKLGAPVRPLCQIALNTRVTKRRVLCGPSLSNCSKYSMLSVKVTMGRDGMSPGFSPGSSFTKRRVLCGPSLSNCSKYSMLSVKVTMRRDGMSPGFSPGNSFTDHTMDVREQVAFLSGRRAAAAKVTMRRDGMSPASCNIPQEGGQSLRCSSASLHLQQHIV